MIALLDLDAPIVPAVGLAGLRLGANVAEYREILRSADTEDSLAWSVFGLWTVTCQFGQVYDWTDDEFEKTFRALERSTLRVQEGLDPDLDLDAAMPDAPPPSLPAVEMRIDMRDGTVYALAALSGYSGSLLEGLTVGMTFGEARLEEPRIYYDSARVAGAIEGIDGISLLGDVPDYPEQDVLDATVVEKIVVFDPERIDSGSSGLAE